MIFKFIFVLSLVIRFNRDMYSRKIIDFYVILSKWNIYLMGYSLFIGYFIVDSDSDF